MDTSHLQATRDYFWAELQNVQALLVGYARERRETTAFLASLHPEEMSQAAALARHADQRATRLRRVLQELDRQIATLAEPEAIEQVAAPAPTAEHAPGE